LGYATGNRSFEIDGAAEGGCAAEKRVHFFIGEQPRTLAHAIDQFPTGAALGRRGGLSLPCQDLLGGRRQQLLLAVRASQEGNRRLPFPEASSPPLPPSAFSGLVDGLHIRQILPPSGCEFGGYEVVAGKKIRPCACRLVDRIFNAALTCRIEIDTGNFRKNIHGYRLASQAEECAGGGEVGEGLTLQAVRRIAPAPHRRHFAFSASGLTRTSISFVARGCAWIETA